MIPRWTLSVVSSALAADPREAARRAQAAGFSGLLFDTFSPAIDLTALSGSGRREFLHVLSSHHQSLVALRFDLDAGGFGDGVDVDRILARFARVLEVAAALRAGCVCTDIGSLPPAPVRPTAKPKIAAHQAGLIILPDMVPQPPQPEPDNRPPAPKFVASVTSALVELGRLADRYSVAIAMSSSLSGFASLQHALGAADCSWFGIDLDPVAILRDRWDLDETISSLGNLIRHVRARDAVAGDDRRTRPARIGEGSVAWPGFLRALDQAGYHGAISIDPADLPDRAAAAVAGLQHLQRSVDK